MKSIPIKLIPVALVFSTTFYLRFFEKFFREFQAINFTHNPISQFNQLLFGQETGVVARVFFYSFRSIKTLLNIANKYF